MADQDVKAKIEAIKDAIKKVRFHFNKSQFFSVLAFAF